MLPAASQADLRGCDDIAARRASADQHHNSSGTMQGQGLQRCKQQPAEALGNPGRADAGTQTLQLGSSSDQAFFSLSSLLSASSLPTLCFGGRADMTRSKLRVVQSNDEYMTEEHENIMHVDAESSDSEPLSCNGKEGFPESDDEEDEDDHDDTADNAEGHFQDIHLTSLEDTQNEDVMYLRLQMEKIEQHMENQDAKILELTEKSRNSERQISTSRDPLGIAHTNSKRKRVYGDLHRQQLGTVGKENNVMRKENCLNDMEMQPPKKCHATHKGGSCCSVYDSLTVADFEDSWMRMLERYNITDNEWLKGLYDNRHRWVPAFVKDAFWAGMSTTQRSESMHAFFDGYVNAKTTLKHFTSQYENALRDKVEKEILADFNSFHSTIPCITHFDVEKQVQSVYTNSKFKEFQEELTNIMYYDRNFIQKEGAIETYKIIEDVLIDKEEGWRKDYVYHVYFNADEFEVKFSCRHFEFRVAEIGAMSDEPCNDLIEQLRTLKIQPPCNSSSENNNGNLATEEGGAPSIGEASKTIISPIAVRCAGRPPSLRKESKVDKLIREAREKKKKAEQREKKKDAQREKKKAEREESPEFGSTSDNINPSITTPLPYGTFEELDAAGGSVCFFQDANRHFAVCQILVDIHRTVIDVLEHFSLLRDFKALPKE
ncbi:hypothetical protein QYE76_064185 [Lolium multiflorum]|uniref:Protein FAR1-RELATED SEQUENCE n=1 Tax=Lolium multiflorum TaxID=4521 RepID=A0AAD8S8G2_LOLMU|nr:hypothetical protein QYE76_064185 [Lolium multiflorum]